MEIKELKNLLESGNIIQSGLIFKSKDTYIPTQYISKISSLSSRDIVYVKSIENVIKEKSIFGDIDSNVINIFITDSISSSIELKDFCYIICESCKNNDFIDVPKLESWQEKDYAITNSSKNISKESIFDIVKSCKGNMFLLDNELSKYSIFSNSDQKNIFESLYKFNQLIRSYDDTIFDFTNAILDKDINKIISIMSNLEKYSIDSMALISIIRKQLRNIILVGFNKNPNESNTGLSSKHIYWIKKNLYKYNSTNLVKNYSFMCDVDKLLKEGVLSSSQLLDYVIINLLI